jgi:penicillin-binding protein 2
VRFGWRLATLGFIFTGLLSVLFVRLWFVQLAEGAAYAEAAELSTLATESQVAPRGDIVDRDGVPLASSRSELVVVVDRSVLTLEQEDQIVQRLSAILNVGPIAIRSELEQTPSGGTAFITDLDVTADIAYTILEQRLDLPGVTIQALPERVYLQDGLMAHVLGHIGLPSEGDLERNQNLDPNIVVGKLGVERQYDEFLQGTPGRVTYEINAGGDILNQLDASVPIQGDTIWLTLKSDTQAVVEQLLADVVVLAQDRKDATESPGERTLPTERAAAVVMDVNTGEIMAMASYPSFDPQSFVGGIGREEFERLADAFAFNNLVIQGLKPPASTFKAVTYLTAMMEGIHPRDTTSVEQPIECSAQLEADFVDASQLVYQNWTRASDGFQNIHDAFRRSCNIYFWELALSIWKTYKDTEDEDILQDWAAALGFGRRTQVDLPFETAGILPDRELFDEWRRTQPWRVRVEGWLGGDLMNLAVGQGSILATPLQLATAYAAMVNGGTVYQPQVVDKIVGADGEVVRDFAPRPLRTPEIDPAIVTSLRNDMAAVVRTGTAAAAFADMGGLELQIGGKTGTAQGFEDADGNRHAATAWFAGVAPIQDPQFVVVVMVDEGGSGGAIAAPAAARIFAHLLGGSPAPLVAGADTD